jgi:anti-sigma factor RsiW
MECRRAEELLSDHAEGSLEDPLLADLKAHLQTCAACSALANAVAEVRVHLVAYPVLEPSASLAERAGERIRAQGLASRLRAFRPAMPPWVMATAAALTLASTLGVLRGAGALPASGKTAHKLVERGVNAGAWVLERRDRLVEDLKLVRVVITAAFEGRLDTMSDRVADYRRTLEKRQEETKGKDKGAGVAPLPQPTPRTAGVHPSEPGGARTRKTL